MPVTKFKSCVATETWPYASMPCTFHNVQELLLRMAGLEDSLYDFFGHCTFPCLEKLFIEVTELELWYLFIRFVSLFYLNVVCLHIHEPFMTKSEMKSEMKLQKPQLHAYSCDVENHFTMPRKEPSRWIFNHLKMIKINSLRLLRFLGRVLKCHIGKYKLIHVYMTSWASFPCKLILQWWILPMVNIIWYQS